jgi:putative (di)nucleoside polyphosphate hydrolase
MIDYTFIKLAAKFAFDRGVRARLFGYRPVAMCIVQAAGGGNRYLLVVPEMNHSIWAPPQEGIRVNESIEDAAHRCLKVELGIEEGQVQFRRSCWLCSRVLPKGRWGERDLEYSLAKMKYGYAMIGKAYFGALVAVAGDVKIRVNPAEVHDYAWVDPDEYLRRVASNVPDKTSIIQMAWAKLVVR